MNALAEYWQEEMAKQEEAPQPKQEEKPDTISLSFWGGEFTFNDGEKKVTGKINPANYKEHANKLWNRANELAKERKMKLSFSDCGSAVLGMCPDYRG